MAIGWAIVGTGLHPDNKIAPAINAADSGELIAIYSRDQNRAEAFARRHGAQAAYSSYPALLQDSRIDAVFVASPNFLHCQHTTLAAEAGKHVLVEKPMATSVADAGEMVRSCRRHGATLGLGFHLRQHPGHIDARESISKGVLGRITLAQAQWGLGVRGRESPRPRTGLREWWGQPEMIGGASSIMGTGVHAIDLLRFLLGQEIVEVAALTDGQREGQPLEDVATMSLRFTGGAIGMVASGRILPDTRNDFTVYGSNGRILGRDILWEVRQGRLEVIGESVDSTGDYPHQYLANYISEVDDFSRAVEEGGEPAATGTDGLRVVQVAQAAVESARSGQSIKFEPAQP